MDLPTLRHFRAEGIFTISSDRVHALVGEAWVPAVYTDKGWATADGASLLAGVEEWRHATQKDDRRQHSHRDESGQTAKAGSGNRIRKSRQKPQG
jgi:hypothetical protein